jgi:hypothetical protein
MLKVIRQYEMSFNFATFEQSNLVEIPGDETLVFHTESVILIFGFTIKVVSQ